jgi:hypothetical protein
MTEQSLTRERNYFLGGFFALAGSAIVIRLWTTQATGYEIRQYADTLLLAQLAAKALFVYLVFRLSRFLLHPAWLTAVYCILTPFSVLYLIPFIGLLIGVANARSRLCVQARPVYRHLTTQKPTIPQIADSLGVVTWFLRHDDKISEFRSRFPTAVMALRDEVVCEINAIQSADQLQQYLSQLSAYYSSVLAHGASEVAAGRNPADGGYAESATAAKMRILGYILLRKYGIQPQT